MSRHHMHSRSDYGTCYVRAGNSPDAGLEFRDEMSGDTEHMGFLRSRWHEWSQTRVGRLLAESFRAQGLLYGISVVAMVIMAGSAGATAWVMEKIIDVMTNPDDRAAVFGVAGLILIIFAVRGVSSYVQSYFLARAGNRVVAMQQERLYRKLLTQGVDFYKDTNSSDLLMRFTQGADAARSLIDILVVGFVRDMFTMIFLLCVMIYQQPTLSMICLLVGPVAFIGVRLLLRQVQSIMKGQLTSMAEIIKVIQETSRGIEIVKVFALENRMIARMDGAVRQVEHRANSIKRLEAITSPLMDILAGIAIAGVVIVSALGVGSGEPATPGQLMSFVTALIMTYEPAKRVSRMRVSIETCMVGVNMIFQLLDKEETLKESPDATPLKPGNGHVEFRNVNYGYRKDEPVIKDMSVVFEPGKTTALVGQSGGGKSTMAALIMRFFDPETGQVLINGQDLRDVTLESLHSNMSYVGQNTFLFASSVMENLRCSRPGATDEEVVDAAKAANAHDFISSLPQGYDTQVGEDGTFLSGGQKQRLAIARAILRKSEVLLLDEATSALDTESEALVKVALQKLTKGRTTIVIAHRLSTIMEADEIFVVQKGQVVERGTPQHLLETGGAFKRLVEHQVSTESAAE